MKAKQFMDKIRARGFTMIELLVVLLIIAVVALMAMPQFQKSAESTRADEAVSNVQILGTTNRIYFLDKAVYAGCQPGVGSCSNYSPGPLNSCQMRGPCNCNALMGSGNNCGDPCTLMFCGYMASQDFSQAPYLYFASDGSVNQADPCGLSASGAPNGFYVACAKRNLNTGPYAGWGYTVDVNGTIQAWPTTNGPPPAPPPS